MVVTFCGHKDVPDVADVENVLRAIISDLIVEGATEFLLGGYGAFDALAAASVRAVKVAHPQIRATLVIPYVDIRFDASLYDESVYPPLETVPRRFAISRRNEWMVDQADVVVAYEPHDWGGAAATRDYSVRKQKRLLHA